MARQWYQKAIEKNHKTARTNLEDLEKYEDKKSLDVNSALIRKNSELHAINEELKKRILSLEARVKLLEATLEEHQNKIIELEEDAVVVGQNVQTDKEITTKEIDV